ncbi:hypothetical protein P879_08538 [Paragonimus westermani]|uniref:UPAR/Ly6 domain-containing protein n=1 Tax=Paragonimus westermani TaxID=34504 RepID=A0A8T0DM96_9TREM|nr:hypothetical protein P879_08538 [Paragonimus westermani]
MFLTILTSSFLILNAGIVTEATKNLTCYVCTGCSFNSSVDKNQTKSGCNWCVIQNLNGFGNRSCMNECPKIPEHFSGRYVRYCCQTNFCNGSDRVGFRLATWSAVIAIGVSMIKH